MTKSYINADNISAVTLNYWPKRCDFASADKRIIEWFDRIVDFNLNAEFMTARPIAKKGRNTLHPHSEYPGWDLSIKTSYLYQNKTWEFDYRYKQNSHYTSVRNSLCPININEMWRLLKPKKNATTQAYESLDSAFGSSFGSMYHGKFMHRGYGQDSDVWGFINSPAFKDECYNAIVKAAESAKVASNVFIKKMAKIEIDGFTNEEILRSIEHASHLAHVLMKHQFSQLKIMDFVHVISLHIADAKLVNAETVEAIKTYRSIKSVHT